MLNLFYKGNLVNYPSVENRPADVAWTVFVRAFISSRDNGNYSIFMSKVKEELQKEFNEKISELRVS